MGMASDLGDGRFAEVRRYLSRVAMIARERTAGSRPDVVRTQPDSSRRPHQELAETAMALLTLWTTFDEPESEHVAAMTRTLLAGHTSEELGFLILHLAGLSRGLTHVLAAQTTSTCRRHCRRSGVTCRAANPRAEPARRRFAATPPLDPVLSFPP